MNLQEILNGQPDKAIELFKLPEFEVEPEKAKAQYFVEGHDVFDKNIRKDKIIQKDTGSVDENGDVITTAAIIPCSRIGLPIQKDIVEQRIGFMLTNPVDYNMTSKTTKGQRIIEMVDDILLKNRTKYKDRDILRRQMSEMQSAELWYFVPTEGKPKFELKCKIVSPWIGDKLYPMYDFYGDMIAFGRAYRLKEDGKEIEHFDIYTKDLEYHFVKKDAWVFDNLEDANGKPIPNPTPNIVGKIMVIYHEQKAPEWADVQSMIDRLEESVSNHADMNDYFGSPILAVMGEIIGFSQKGEQGKILELEHDAKANYLTISTPPESIRMEQAQLRELVFALSNTADISFDKVKGIGNLSAIALNLLFISSTMAAKAKEETFIVGLQRRVNLIMACIGKVLDTSLASDIPTVRVEPKLNVYQPSDVNELLKTLGQAKQDGIMSVEAIVENNPLIIEKEKEVVLLKAAKEEEAKAIENKVVEPKPIVE